MTKFQFFSDLINITNGLLEMGVNSCNAHQTRQYMDEAIENFEESEGVETSGGNTRGDLEMYYYLIDNLYQKGHQLYLEEKHQEEKKYMTDRTDLEIVLNDIAKKEAAMPRELKNYFHTVDHIQEDGYIVFLDESEGTFTDYIDYDVTCSDGEGDCYVII
jgi:mRNA-degrading endonuclease HigB of HigAB toxin-antitoxin module